MATRPTAPANRAPAAEPAALVEELNRVREALNGLLYGTVTVIVHDGVVVQIDRTEKLRFGRSAAACA
jgi:hypothetical protein